MNKIVKQRKLCDDAVLLIKEFSKEAGFISESQIKKVESNEAGNTIIITNKCGQSIEYNLSEIGYLFEDKILNFWPCGNRFFIDIQNLKSNSTKYYSELERLEFIECIGNLNYTELKCMDLLDRIKLIEAETLYL